RDRSVTPPRTRQATTRPSGFNAPEKASTLGSATIRGVPRRSHTSKGYDTPQAIRRSPSGVKASDQTAPRAPGFFRICIAPSSEVHVPDDDRAALAAGRRPHAVGGEGQRHEGPDVPVVGRRLPPGGRVPEAHRLVVAGGGQEAAVRRERHRLEVPGIDLLL